MEQEVHQSLLREGKAWISCHLQRGQSKHAKAIKRGVFGACRHRKLLEHDEYQPSYVGENRTCMHYG